MTACILGEAQIVDRSDPASWTPRRVQRSGCSRSSVHRDTHPCCARRQAILGHRIIWCPGAESNKAILAASYRHI